MMFRLFGCGGTSGFKFLFFFRGYIRQVANKTDYLPNFLIEHRRKQPVPQIDTDSENILFEAGVARFSPLEIHFGLGGLNFHLSAIDCRLGGGDSQSGKLHGRPSQIDFPPGNIGFRWSRIDFRLGGNEYRLSEIDFRLGGTEV